MYFGTFFKNFIVSICICLADYVPVCWWKLWRMCGLAGTLVLWHSGILVPWLVLVTTYMVGSKMCSLRSTSIFSLPHLVQLQWFISMCIFIVFHKPYLLTCDILSTPIPIQLLRGPSEQPELEWCSLKPQNLRVFSQLQSCWRLIELTIHCWTFCLYRIKSHSHWGTYIITGTGSIPLRRSFIQQAILCIYSQVAKKEWM